jgi:hypothetical protein
MEKTVVLQNIQGVKGEGRARLGVIG